MCSAGFFINTHGFIILKMYTPSYPNRKHVYDRRRKIYSKQSPALPAHSSMVQHEQIYMGNKKKKVEVQHSNVFQSLEVSISGY